MFLVRPGTPISDVDPDDLPSPRGDSKLKATQVLPHYMEIKEDRDKPKRIIPRKPYEDRNLREILDLLYRNRKYVSILILLYLTNQKGPTFYVKREYDGNKGRTLEELKNSEILKKARMAKNANSGQININHLSPIRIENNFKDIEIVNINYEYEFNGLVQRN